MESFEIENFDKFRKRECHERKFNQIDRQTTKQSSGRIQKRVFLMDTIKNLWSSYQKITSNSLFIKQFEFLN